MMNMNEMELLYCDLQRKKAEAESRLLEYRKRLDNISGQKQSITIKKIHGDLYYYSQYRRDGKVKSRYLGPVSPGSIAEEEQKQMEIESLTDEIRELQWNIESLERMTECLRKRKKKEKIVDSLLFEVYWKDEITARVYARGSDVIISRFTDNPGKQLFAEKKMTRYQLGRIFELRCWEKDRPDINGILEYLGLDEYNPYEIVKKTHGVSCNDYIWFRFPGEKITSKDVLVR